MIGAKNPTPALFRSASRATRMSSYSSCTYCASTGRLRKYARLWRASSFWPRDATVGKKKVRIQGERGCQDGQGDSRHLGDSLMKREAMHNTPPGISWTAKAISHCLLLLGMCKLIPYKVR